MYHFSYDERNVEVLFNPQDKTIAISVKHDDGFALTATVPLDVADDSRIQAAIDALTKMCGDDPGQLPESGAVTSLLPLRADKALRPIERMVRAMGQWLVASREKTNWTYELRPMNLVHAAHTVCQVTGAPYNAVQSMMNELLGNTDLQAHVASTVVNGAVEWRIAADPVFRPARRIVWYAIARLTKPRLVIETGVDQGLGGLVLCEALRRNSEEGFEGRYLGTDIVEGAGGLIGGPWAEFGEVVIGDSLETLKILNDPVDLFINDSDHSESYEAREYATVDPRLSERAVLLSDNAMVTLALEAYARHTSRSFLAFREMPLDHWYLGSGVGIAWRPGFVLP